MSRTINTKTINTPKTINTSKINNTKLFNRLDNLIKNIEVKSEPNLVLNYSIISILLKDLKKYTLLDILTKFFKLDDKYKSLIEHINNNFKNKNTTLATITLNLSHHKNLHQLYIILIDDTTFQETNDSELREALRINGTTIYNIMKNNNLRKINILNNFNNIEQLECLLEGLLLSSYRFNKYKTIKALNKNWKKYTLEQLNLIITKSFNKTDNILDLLRNKKCIIESVFLARDLINEPANNNRIDRFIKSIEIFINKFRIPIELEILNKNQIEKLGMGLLLAVGKGSNKNNEPKLLILKYKPQQLDKTLKTPEYVLLGKGITFDTGGLDLKTKGNMIEMKSDLSGAASIISFLLGYAKLNGNKCIYGICPFAENSIGPDSIKPSDVVKAYDGRTVEITDTDAEGRLILADCLAYSVDKYPKSTLIDIATLTGEQERISGKMFSCILGTNTNLKIQKMIELGKQINEPLVQLPLLDDQLNKLESYIADIKNVNYSSKADIIMSSLFMKQFIKKNTNWIHIDIAGPSFKLNELVKYASPEASGIGVRLLFEYFK